MRDGHNRIRSNLGKRTGIRTNKNKKTSKKKMRNQTETMIVVSEGLDAGHDSDDGPYQPVAEPGGER